MPPLANVQEADKQQTTYQLSGMKAENGDTSNVFAAFRPEYNIFDVRSNHFPKEKMGKMISLYADVFNSVSTVKAKWNEQTVTALFNHRLGMEPGVDRPSVALALFDVSGEDPVAFWLCDIKPSREGPVLTSIDIGIGPKCKTGISTELDYQGLFLASEFCTRIFNQPAATVQSETYKKQDFPRVYWEKLGYIPTKLFIASAQDVCLPRTNNKQPAISIKALEQNEVEDLAKFMSDPLTIVSDQGRWKKEQAEMFLNYMAEYNPGLIYVAKKQDKVVGIMGGDISPRRSGPNLVDLNCCLSSQVTEFERLSIARDLFNVLLLSANAVAMSHKDGQLREIEVPETSSSFFKKIINLKEDEEFVHLSGKASDIIEKHIKKMGETQSMPRTVLINRPLGVVPESASTTQRLG